LAINGLVLTPGGDFLALRPSEGNAAPEVVWKSNRLSSSYTSPVAYLDRVYAVNGTGVLNCADLATGKTVWQERLNGPYWASPIIADGKAYVVNEKGVAMVVQLGAKPKVVDTNDLKDPISATPAISGGAIFLRSEKHLYCIAEGK
jgi:outer membrane protein assembly factor BamB